MNQQLAGKILADLATTGFDSEMRAIHACRVAAWSTSGSASYYDRDADITREIDLTAYRVLNAKDSDGQFAVDCTLHYLGRGEEVGGSVGCVQSAGATGQVDRRVAEPDLR